MCHFTLLLQVQKTDQKEDSGKMFDHSLEILYNHGTACYENSTKDFFWRIIDWSGLIGGASIFLLFFFFNK